MAFSTKEDFDSDPGFDVIICTSYPGSESESLILCNVSSTNSAARFNLEEGLDDIYGYVTIEKLFLESHGCCNTINVTGE